MVVNSRKNLIMQEEIEKLAQAVSNWFVKKLRKPIPGNGGIPEDNDSFPSFYGMVHNSNECEKYPLSEESLLKFGELVKQRIITESLEKNRRKFFGFGKDYNLEGALREIADEAGIHNCHFPMKMYLAIDFVQNTAHFQINIQNIREDIYPKN